MKNLAQKPKNENTKWLSLDEYVSVGNASIMYVRVHGKGIGNIGNGDLAIIDRNRKPTTNDIIVYQNGEKYAITSYADVKQFTKPSLHLVAKNGKTIKGKPKVAEKINLIGVITYVLREVAQ